LSVETICRSNSLLNVTLALRPRYAHHQALSDQKEIYMERNEIIRLEQLIQLAKAANSAINSCDEWDELMRVIHSPGWTTPPEAILVSKIIDSIITQSHQIIALRSGLLAAARLVGKSVAVGV
jgi:hypothetical protein